MKTVCPAGTARGLAVPHTDAAGAGCNLCPLVEAAAYLRSWPHRCVFSGDGIQAWLIGLTARSAPLNFLSRASLNLIVTFGKMDVICSDAVHGLTHGRTLAIEPATAVQIQTVTQADLLLVMTVV